MLQVHRRLRGAKAAASPPGWPAAGCAWWRPVK